MKFPIPNFSKFDLNVNKVIKILVTGDFVLWFAMGLLSPIFAIFVVDNIEGGSVTVVGLAASLYWIARILTTVPLSRFMDRTDGEKDELAFMITGYLVISVIFALYIYASKPWHVYALQALFGFSNSMAVPAWRIIFTNHIDRGRTGYYWSIEDIAIGVATATSASLGALIASKFGFNFVLAMVSTLALVSALIVLALRKYTYTLGEMKKLSKERKKFQAFLKKNRD